LIPKQLKRHGLTRKNLSVPETVLKVIINDYSREAGVRSLENNIKKIMRKSAKNIVEKDGKKISIKINDLHNILGKKMFEEDRMYKKPRVGVITGLAYTSMGGATLNIEAIKVPVNKPGFKQTGQLGAVMIESSEIAYTYIRSFLKNNSDATEILNKNHIHLHVPAGAIPKDGPSAGITMACALYSLVLEKTIIKNIAMTGELTLSGLVMPIGGLKEKVIAAKRRGIKKLIFPVENKIDFEDLDDNIKEGVIPYFVSTFAEVIKICFP
jgi:ATP-dependent Lon protease